MPTVVFQCEDRGNPAFKNLFHRIPLKNGEDGKRLGKSRLLPQFAVHTGTEVTPESGGVLLYAYGGAERVVRKGDKQAMDAHEVQFLNHNFPGLIDVIVGETGGVDDVAPVLLEKTKVAERERDIALAEAAQAKNALLNVSSAKEAAENAAAKVSVDVSNRDDQIAELKAQLTAAQALLAEAKAINTKAPAVEPESKAKSK